MRYSLEPRYRRYIKGYGFLSSARKFRDKYGKKVMDTATKTEIKPGKKFKDKYDKNLKDTAKEQGTNFAKTAGTKIVQTSAEATGDLIGNKIADKITSLGKSKTKEK